MRKIAASAATTTAATMPRITALPYGPDGLNTAVSTRKDTVDVAELPARSYACTVTVCDPSASPDNTNEVVVAEKLWGEPPSRLTSKWSIPLVASDPAAEIATQCLSGEKAVEEYRQRCHLGVGLVPDRHVQVHEVVHVARNLLRPDDNEESVGPDLWHVRIEGKAVHREMHLRAWPIPQDATPCDARVDPKRASEPPDHVADRPLQDRVFG